MLLQYSLYAQLLNLDSLSEQLKHATDDTMRVKILYQLSENSPTDSGNLFYAEQVLELAKKINYQKGIADALNNIGYVYSNRGDNSEALQLHEQSLKIGEEIGDKEGVAITLNNIAYIYQMIGDIKKSLTYNERSLKIREEINDKKGIAYSLNNIANIFSDQGDYDKALEYMSRGLKISEGLSDKRTLALAFSNLGSVYEYRKETGKAIECYKKCLQISEEINYKSGIATAYNNLGSIYMQQRNFTSALDYYKQSLILQQEIGNKGNEVSLLDNLSTCYFNLKDYGNAISYGNEAFKLANEIGYPALIKDASSALAKANAATGNYKQAYEMHIVYKSMADSVSNQATREATVKNQMQYEFSKVQDAQKAEQQKKDAISQAALQKQKLVRNGLIAGFAALLLFSIIIYRQRNFIFKAKQRSDELLLNILPGETADELKTTGKAKTKKFNEVTVLFTDFKNFTSISEELSAEELVSEINFCYSAFDHIISKYGIEKIKTIGDSYMCAAGLPVETATHAEDALNAAFEIRDFMLREKAKHDSAGKLFFEIRIGLNTGPVVAGIVGIKKFAYDIWGNTVNIASRMEEMSEAGKINISTSTFEKIKHKFDCTHRGKINVKNKGDVDMYFVEQISSESRKENLI
ncbi:MAG: adenylate/guanylate cyclase domain-containing protein [Bacteroidia bacterium]